MSADTHADRTIRAWLDLMPDEAPDRAIDAVLQAVESTTQVRRPLGVAAWRATPMQRLFIGAAGIAAIVVVILAGVVSGGRPTPSVGPPASAPPPAATAVPTAEPPATLPAELLGTYRGAHRDVPGIEGGAGTVLSLRPGAATFAQSNKQPFPQLTEQVVASGSDSFEVTAASARECGDGVTGSYRWRLSPSGRTLTVSLAADACTRRADGLSGVWWRVGCPDAPCTGPLDAGTYGSQYFTPRIRTDDQRSRDEWTPPYGALTFTLPDGWINSGDEPGSYALTPAATDGRESSSGPAPGSESEIDLYAQPRITADGSRCDGVPDPKVGRTVGALVAHLEHDPALTVAKEPSQTIGGFPATVLDVGLDPSWTGTCPDLARAYGFLGGVNGWSPDGLDDYGANLVGAGRDRLLLVDLGRGDVVAIVIDSGQPSAFDGLLAQATPIIDSFRFAPAP